MRVAMQTVDDPTVSATPDLRFRIANELEHRLVRLQRSPLVTWRSPAYLGCLSADEINASTVDVVNIHWTPAGAPATPGPIARRLSGASISTGSRGNARPSGGHSPAYRRREQLDAAGRRGQRAHARLADSSDPPCHRLRRVRDDGHGRCTQGAGPAAMGSAHSLPPLGRHQRRSQGLGPPRRGAAGSQA